MALILHIETATPTCSVALSLDGLVLALQEETGRNLHASSITLYIVEVMKKAGRELAELDAVCVSKGPGSYTGLRIGLSAAKGLCYALDKPLIGICTLESMAAGFLQQFGETLPGSIPGSPAPPGPGTGAGAGDEPVTGAFPEPGTGGSGLGRLSSAPEEGTEHAGNAPGWSGSLKTDASSAGASAEPGAAGQPLLCPLLDARRMEVFTAMYDTGLRVRETARARVVDEHTWEPRLADHPVCFFGTGAAKCRDLYLRHTGAHFFPDFRPSAAHLVGPAEERFAAGRFEDVAYFEPFYLKDFAASAPAGTSGKGSRS